MKWTTTIFALTLAIAFGCFCAFQFTGSRIVRADDGNEKWADKVAFDREIERLKQTAPDQAHAMMDVEYHFSNLWFAGQAENWPLAEFYWKETLSHLRWAVRIIPIRKDSAGQPVDLVGILSSMENSPFMQLGQVIGRKDRAEFEKTYRVVLGGCYSCHKASEKPYLRPGIPESQRSSIIQVDPKAEWPK